MKEKGFLQKLSQAQIFFVVGLVHIFFIGGYVNNVMLSSKTNLTVAIVDDQSIKIDAYAGNSTDVSEREGHYYSGMPPGLSLLLVPSYLATKVLFLFVPENLEIKWDRTLNSKIAQKHTFLPGGKKRTRIVLTNILGVLLLSIPLLFTVTMLLQEALVRCMQVPIQIAQTIGVLFMLLSPYAAFTASLWHTTVAAAFLFLALATLYLNWNRSLAPLTVLGIALLLGFLPTLDYPAFAYALVVFAGVCVQVAKQREWLKFFPLLMGFSLPIACLLWYHHVAFGDMFTTAYHYRISSDLFDKMKMEAAANGAATFLPSFAKLWRSFFNDNCGVILFHPLYLPAFVATGLNIWRRPKEWPIWLGASVLFLGNFWYFTSLPSSVNPAAGSFGARYTLYLAPFTFLVLGPVLAAGIQRFKFLLLACLGLLHIPNLMYWFFGAPVRTPAEYLSLLSQQGPSSYTLSKLWQAGFIQSSAVNWMVFGAFALFLIVLLWLPSQLAQSSQPK